MCTESRPVLLGLPLYPATATLAIHRTTHAF